MNQYNINLLLCKSCDSELKRIENVFDKIQSVDGKVSFSVITLLNAINCDSDEKFTLHYYLIKKQKEPNGKNKGIYLGKTNMEYLVESKNSEDRDNSVNIFTFSDVPVFPGESHILEVHKTDCREESFEETLQKQQEYRRADNMVSTYEFRVS